MIQKTCYEIFLTGAQIAALENQNCKICCHNHNNLRLRKFGAIYQQEKLLVTSLPIIFQQQDLLILW